MTCTACAKAAADPRSGEFMLRCNECQTRQLAEWIAWWEDGTPLAGYWSALEKITRDGEEPKDAHERVKAWAERIKGAA